MKKSWKTWTGIGCLVILVAGCILTGVGAIILKRAARPEKLRTLAEQKLTAAAGEPVHIAGMDFHIFPLPTLDATGVAVGDPSKPALSLERVVIKPAILPLLGRHLIIRSVELEKPDLTFRRDRNGKWIFPLTLPAAKGGGAKKSGGEAPVIQKLLIKNGRIHYRDEKFLAPGGRPLDLTLSGIDAEWNLGAAGGLDVKLQGSLQDGGQVSLSAKKSPSLSMEANLKSVKAATLAPLLWSFARIAPVSGKVSIQTQAKGPDLDHLAADVSVKLDQVGSPGFGAPKATGPITPVSGSIRSGLKWTSSGVDITSVSADLPHTHITGSGRAGSGGASLNLASQSVDSRDLPALQALFGMAPIPGLSISGKCPLKVSIRIPSGPRPLSATGSAEIEALRLSTLQIEQVSTKLNLASGVLKLSPLTFKAYGGAEKGEITLDLDRTPIQYAVKTEMSGVDVNKVLSSNTKVKDTLYGTGLAKADVKGVGFTAGALKQSLSGTASLDVKKGVIKNFPLLATVNRVLKVTGGSGKDTQFDSLTGDFKIAGGKAHSDNINLKAGEMTVHGAGDIGFNLILDIKGRIVFSPEKTQELVHSVGELSSLVNQKGRLVLPLVISGSVDNPSINIDIKDLLKKKLQKDLKDKLLQKLFG